MNALTIPRNVQFMYEHAIAQFELREGWDLNVDTDPLDPWSLGSHLNGQKGSILSRSAYVGKVDEKETVYAQLIRPSYQGGEFNETRSANQYLTHWIYPYKGKFHPQMIRGLLNGIRAKPGWTVLDNFSGSGTSLLECQLLGIDSIGIDMSPLCVLLGKVKTRAWRVVDIIEQVVTDLTEIEDLHPNDVTPNEYEPQEVADFLEIARMVTLSDVERRKYDAETYYPKNLRKMLRSCKAMARAIKKFKIQPGRADFRRGDARDLKEAGIADSSVDAIVTSPPYSVALDYVKNDKHALKDMGCDLDALRQEFIGLRGKGTQKRIDFYREDMQVAVSEMARVLKPGGRGIVVIGNVTKNGEEVLTTEETVEWAENAGLSLDRSLKKVVFGLYNVMRDEEILFFTR